MRLVAMTNPVRFCLLVVLLTLSVGLSSCWIPENFDAKVVVNRDGSYTFTYDGTLTFGPALAAAVQGGLSPKDEAELRGEAAKLSREPGFKRVEYQGKGRYKVLVEKSGRHGEPFYFVSQELKMFSVLPQADGTIAVGAFRPDKQAIEQMAAIGAKIDGTLSVSAGSGVSVIRHNAQSEPYMFGLIGTYKWQIKSPASDPLIVLRPSL